MKSMVRPLPAQTPHASRPWLQHWPALSRVTLAPAVVLIAQQVPASLTTPGAKEKACKQSYHCNTAMTTDAQRICCCQCRLPYHLVSHCLPITHPKQALGASWIVQRTTGGGANASMFHGITSKPCSISLTRTAACAIAVDNACAAADLCRVAASCTAVRDCCSGVAQACGDGAVGACVARLTLASRGGGIADTIVGTVCRGVAGEGVTQAG